MTYTQKLIFAYPNLRHGTKQKTEGERTLRVKQSQ